MIDPHSLSWRTVSGRCRTEIESALDRIARKGCDERVADFERGRIAALRDVLALEQANAAPAHVSQSVSYAD